MRKISGEKNTTGCFLCLIVLMEGRMCSVIQEMEKKDQTGNETCFMRGETHCKGIRRPPGAVRSARWGSSPEEGAAGSEPRPAAAACTEQRCRRYCYLEKTENTDMYHLYHHLHNSDDGNTLFGAKYRQHLSHGRTMSNHLAAMSALTQALAAMLTMPGAEPSMLPRWKSSGIQK